MDLRLLEYIVAIADQGNISRAADELYISQSGLNQQLIHLEKSLNTKLFDRNKHYLQLTQAGDIYVESAREILNIRNNAYVKINDLTENKIGKISFGITHEHGVDLFTSVFPLFNNEYPHITIKLQECVVSKQNTLLTAGTLDLGCVLLSESDKLPNLEYITLCHENLVLGIPRSNPLSKLAAPPGQPLSTIDLSLFSDESFSLMFEGSTMRNLIDPLFKKAGFKPKILFETTINHALSKMVGRGLCCTIIPQSYAKNKDTVAWFYLKSNPVWQLAMVYNKNRQLGTAAKYLIRLAKEYGKNLEYSLLNGYSIQ